MLSQLQWIRGGARQMLHSVIFCDYVGRETQKSCMYERSKLNGPDGHNRVRTSAIKRTVSVPTNPTQGCTPVTHSTE